MKDANSNSDSWIQNWLDRTSSLIVLVCGISLVVLVVVFGWLVFGRYVLNVTPTWVEQLGLVLVVVITFLCAAVGVHEETHLAVTYFRTLAPPPVQAILHIISDLLLCGFGVVMMYASYQLVIFGWSTNLPMLNIPEGVRTIPVVICGALMAVFAGVRVVGRIRYFSDFVDRLKNPPALDPDGAA